MQNRYNITRSQNRNSNVLGDVNRVNYRYARRGNGERNNGECEQSNTLADTINDAYRDGYCDGVQDGFENGCRQCYQQGVQDGYAKAKQEILNTVCRRRCCRRRCCC